MSYNLSMRKIFFTVLLGTIGLFMAGCGTNPDAPAAQPTSIPSPAQAVGIPDVTAIPSAITATSMVGRAAATPTDWVPPTSLVGTPILGAVATLTAAPKLKTERIALMNRAGERAEMIVEVADTGPGRELGLMFRTGMDPDAGMLFDFTVDTTEGFWMQNTILPLSIGFIQSDGTIIDVQDMKPLDTTTINAPAPYLYALETNQGFFRVHNLQKGDKVTFSKQTIALPGMPGCAQK